MKSFLFTLILALPALLWAVAGCRSSQSGPSHDRPFPIGQVTDSFWETQQTNAEAADFIFHEHEFVGETTELAPDTRRHLESVALRWEHVPFPIVIEPQQLNPKPDLDRARRRVIIEHLARMGIHQPEGRVVVAHAHAEGFTALEGERAFSNILRSGGRGGSGGVGGSGS